MEIKGIPLARRPGTGGQKGYTGLPQPGAVQRQFFFCFGKTIWLQ